MSAGDIHTAEYEKHVLRCRSEATGVAYHKYGGGLGDFVYFLAFVGPAVDAEPKFKHVLIADSCNDEPRNQALVDLCKAHDRFDEVWTCQEEGGSPFRWPPDLAEAVGNDSSQQVKLYRPNIYGPMPGCFKFSQYDDRVLMGAARPKPISLLRNPNVDGLRDEYPFLFDGRKIVTVQPRTGGKSTMFELDPGVVKLLARLDCWVVILLSARGSEVYDVDQFEGLNNIRVVVTPCLVDAIRVMHKSDVHTGVESCLAMVAMVLGVPAVVKITSGLYSFVQQLSVTSLVQLPFRTTSVDRVVMEVLCLL